MIRRNHLTDLVSAQFSSSAIERRFAYSQKVHTFWDTNEKYFWNSAFKMLMVYFLFPGQAACLDQVAPGQGLQPQDPGGAQGAVLQGPRCKYFKFIFTHLTHEANFVHLLFLENIVHLF